MEVFFAAETVELSSAAEGSGIHASGFLADPAREEFQGVEIVREGAVETGSAAAFGYCCGDGLRVDIESDEE
jgi:hypothetical protein